MDCVTPSHPDKIPHGESVSITQLLDKGSAAYLDPSIIPEMPIDLDQHPYTPRPPVMSELRESPNIDYLKAQISTSTKELADLIKDISKRSSSKNTTTPPSSAKSSSMKENSSSWSKNPVSTYAPPQEPRLVDAPYGYEGVTRFWERASTKGGQFGKPWIRTQLAGKTVLNDRP